MTNLRQLKSRDLLALIALSVLLTLIALALVSCAAPAGSRAERNQLQAIDSLGKVNDGIRTYVAPALPTPYREMLEGAGIVTAAGLAYWLRRVHGKVDRLSQNTHAPRSQLKT